MLAALDEPFQQTQQCLAVIVGPKPVRPERQGLRPDAYRTDMLESRLKKRCKRFLQVIVFHYNTIAPAHQQVADRRVPAQIVMKHSGVGAGNAQCLVADKLGPAEAEGGSCGRFALAREEQQRLAIIVLQPIDALALALALAFTRPVAFHVSRGIQIELDTQLACKGLDLGPAGTCPVQTGHAVEGLGRQHVALREGQLEHRVVRNVVPWADTRSCRQSRPP